MSIEPERALSAPRSARVIGVREPAKFVAPVMSMRDDAKRCNAAMRKHNGHGSYTPNNGISPSQRAAQIAQRSAWFGTLRPMMQQAPMYLPQICAAWGMSKGAENQRIRLLEAEGYVKRMVGTSRVMWRLA